MGRRLKKCSLPGYSPGAYPLSLLNSKGLRSTVISIRSNGLRYALALAVLVGVWGLWNESFSLRSIIEGGIFAVLSLYITNRFVLRAPWHERFVIHPLLLLKYVAVVFVEIYKAGFDAIRMTLRDELNVGIVNIRTNSTNALRGVLIANAITLTPGTVTIDFHEGHLKVVWINCTSSDPEEAGEIIKGTFERIFRYETGDTR